MNFYFFGIRGSYNIVNMTKKSFKNVKVHESLIKSWDQKLWLNIFEGPKVVEIFIENKNKIQDIYRD
jgi:hypothetical protein